MTAPRARSIVTAEGFGLPRPGSGRTRERFAELTRFTTEDISTGRLVEAHADADAILGEICGGGTGPGEFWAVWASNPPQTRVDAIREQGGWRLNGTKPWCSGAGHCTHALITAHTDDGDRLFAVNLDQPGIEADGSGWHTAGMRDSETATVYLDGASAEPVGAPGRYLERPGFWHGGIGVAACWFGGARRVARPLYRTAVRRDDEILRMHLGAVDALLAGGWAHLMAAADAIDAHPDASATRLAHQVRWSVEQIATAVIDRVGRALGPGPLAGDAEHAQAVADLQVYIRQSHADRDLVTLGSVVAGSLSGTIPGPTASTTTASKTSPSKGERR